MNGKVKASPFTAEDILSSCCLCVGKKTSAQSMKRQWAGFRLEDKPLLCPLKMDMSSDKGEIFDLE